MKSIKGTEVTLVEDKESPAKAATKKPKLSSKMEREFETLLAEKGDRFRRSDLAERLKQYTNPRSLKVADELAGMIMAKAKKDGVIVSAGSVLWKVATRSRKTKSGRPLAELSAPVEISLKSKVPEKYLILDNETGDVWAPNKQGKLARATTAQINEARDLLK